MYIKISNSDWSSLTDALLIGQCKNGDIICKTDTPPKTYKELTDWGYSDFTSRVFDGKEQSIGKIELRYIQEWYEATDYKCLKNIRKNKDYKDNDTKWKDYLAEYDYMQLLAKEIETATKEQELFINNI